jgi:hypothetical protein
MPSGQRIVGRNVTGNLGGYHQPYVALAQVWQTNRSIAPIRQVCFTLFSGTNFWYGAAQVAVPLHGVHAEVEMGIE